MNMKIKILLIIIISIVGLLISCANCQPEKPLLEPFEPFEGGPDKILAYNKYYNEIVVIDSNTDEVIRKLYFNVTVANHSWSGNNAIFYSMDNGIYVSSSNDTLSEIILDSKNGTYKEILEGKDSIAHAYPLDGTRFAFLGTCLVGSGKENFYILDAQKGEIIHQDAFISDGLEIDSLNNKIIASTKDSSFSKSTTIFTIDNETYNRETIFEDPIEGGGSGTERYTENFSHALTENYWYVFYAESTKYPPVGEAYLYKYNYNNVQVGARQKIFETITEKPRSIVKRYKDPLNSNIVYLTLTESYEPGNIETYGDVYLIRFNLETMTLEEYIVINEKRSTIPWFYGMANGKIYIPSYDNTEDIKAGVTNAIDCSDFSNITKIYPDEFGG